METIQLRGGCEKGIGIPAGGGMIYHPDHSVEPIRHHLYEFSVEDGQVTSSMLIPNPEADELDSE